MRIEANTSEMLNAASTLRNQATEYKQLADAMLNEVKQIQGAAWVGEDAQQFIAKVEGLRDDFERMYELLMGASNDMKESAEKYDQTQSAARSAAAGLADGF